MAQTPPIANRSPERKVLQEQNPSKTNQIPQRAPRLHAKQKSASSTPYPTKPAHVLLPSSVRNRHRPAHSCASPLAARTAKGKGKGDGAERQETAPLTNAENPTTVKRSVSELRSLYERQTGPKYLSARASSRLSGASLSPGSEEPLSEQRSDDNRSLLPAISDEAIAPYVPVQPSNSIKKVQSQASLPAPPSTPPDWSSPDLSAIASPSDPDLSPARAFSGPEHHARADLSSDSARPTDLPSSPNLVRLAHTSSQTLDSESSLSNPSILPIPPPLNLRLDRIPPLNLKGAPAGRSSSPPSEPATISSSPNVVKLGTSSPTYDISTRRDDSPKSFPTSPSPAPDQYHEIVHEQPSTSTLSSFGQPFNSSPPDQGRSTPSRTSRHLPPASAPRPLPALPHQSGGSRAHAELQTALESSPVPEIHYPVVPAPRTSSWEDLNVPKRAPRQPDHQGRPAPWNPHLSTVPSEWSGENQLGSFHTIDTDDISDTESMLDSPEGAYLPDANSTDSTTSILTEAHHAEAADVISHLRVPQLRHQASGLLGALSENSRAASFGSFVLRSHASNGSLQTTIRFPAWACRYYSRGLGDSFNPLRPETANSTISQPSWPVTAVAPIVEQTMEQTISTFSRPRIRAGKEARDIHPLLGPPPRTSDLPRSRVSSLAVDPADPRAHWAGAEQAAMEAELHHGASARSRVVDGWSPHLFPNHRPDDRHRWLAPSIDETNTPIFTWRNAQVIGFILGFLFPVSWFVAALLPLPPKPAPKEMVHDPNVGGPTLQQQLDHRAAMAGELRYANLRWWRNLNRFMCVVGLVIVAIVITLAVVGTRRGFAV